LARPLPPSAPGRSRWFATYRCRCARTAGSIEWDGGLRALVAEVVDDGGHQGGFPGGNGSPRPGGRGRPGGVTSPQARGRSSRKSFCPCSDDGPVGPGGTKRTDCSQKASIRSIPDRKAARIARILTVRLTSEHHAARRLQNRPITAIAPSPNPSSTTLEGSGIVVDDPKIPI